MQRVIVIGNSHSDAVKRAAHKSPEIMESFDLSVLRLNSVRKDGRVMGDISIDDATDLCAGLSERDLVVSAIGGNQHSMFSLVQHQRPFDVLDETHHTPMPGCDVVPRNLIFARFEDGMRSNDVHTMSRLASAGLAQMLHLTPPPPKSDETHILNSVKENFKKMGIFDTGVSPADLRLRIWRLQVDVLRKLLPEAGIGLLPPPQDSLDEDGFLIPACYADDATHGNVKYGRMVLRQIKKYLRTPAAS